MKILFVCEYNACRSQMAEGLARKLLPEDFSIQSAGVHDGELNRLTCEVMNEIGIDISRQKSKRLENLKNISFDWVIVLADPAWAAAREIQAKGRALWHFPDPVADSGEKEEVKKKIRIVRDGIRKRIMEIGKGRR